MVPCFRSITSRNQGILPKPVTLSDLDTCDPETIKASVASLPADTRELFQLFFDHGFTHPEIAEKTGLPLGTVKTRLRRGLKAQYQLWIVDPSRDADAPVDGGVFDIPADGSPVVVPITAKLALSKPQAFVITLEQPGGVVKSKQEKVVALAKG